MTGSSTRAPPAASASTSAVVPGSVPKGRYAHTVPNVTFDTALTSADASWACDSAVWSARARVSRVRHSALLRCSLPSACMTSR